MRETHDTIDGLLAEFRGYSAGMPASYHVTMSWADFRKMLTRFEAAHDHDIATATEASARAVVGACVKQQGAERKCVALREALERVLCWLKRMNAQPLNTLAISELTPSYAVNRTAKSIIKDNDYHISQLTAALAAPEKEGGVK